MIFRGRRGMNWFWKACVMNKADQMERTAVCSLAVRSSAQKDITQLPALMSWVGSWARRPG